MQPSTRKSYLQGRLVSSSADLRFRCFDLLHHIVLQLDGLL